MKDAHTVTDTNIFTQKVILIWVVFLFFGCLHLYSNTLSASPFFYNYQYKNFKNIYLPIEASTINTIFQDNIGLVWIGTNQGLFSYNGYSIQKYVIDIDIEYNNVSAIIQLNENYLCIGTEHGLRFFNLYTEQFDNPYPVTEPIRSVRSLILWNDKLWIGTNNKGLLYFDLKSKSLHQMPNESEENKSIVYSFEPANDILYIGSYDGLSYYDPSKHVRRQISFPEQYKNLMVNSLLFDKEQECLWIGTEGCLFRYHLKDSSFECSSLLPSNSFKALTFDNRNNLIIGTDNALYTYNNKTKKVDHIIHDSRNKRSLCNNVIWCSYTDRNNNIWLGTDYGISLITDNSISKFIHISELTGSGDGNQFTQIYKDSTGVYWLGGVNGLLMFDKEGKKKWFNTENNECRLLHNRIRRIYEDRNNNIWIATDGGIARYDAERKAFVYYTIVDETNSKNANWAYDIYEDKNANLWIATYLGGLFIVNKRKLISHNSKKAYKAEWNFSKNNDSTRLSNIILRIESDKSGFIWANTQNGLVKIDPDTKAVHPFNIHLTQMIYDGEQHIWYSSNHVLYRINISTNAIEKVEELSKDNQIYSFVLENDHIWISCTEGLIAWDRNTLHKKNILSEGYYQSGFYDKQHNTILWGGYDGIACSSIQTLKKAKTSSLVIVTSIWVNNKRLMPVTDYEGISIKYSHRIELSYTKRNLVLELSTLTYSPEYDNGFYYSFEDENKWNKLNPGQNRISFANLHHGKYRLSICSENPESSQGAIINNFEFIILPPWYASTAACIIYITIILCITLLVVRRIRRNIRRKYERIEKEKTLELSNLKMDFFINVSHELKTPLSLIIAPLSSLMAATKKTEYKQKLEDIYKNALKLNMLIHQVLDFRQIEHESEDTLIRSNIELHSFLEKILNDYSSTFEAKKIQSHLTVDKEHVWMNLDLIKMESVFTNLLTNAIKFIPETGGKIDVHLIQKEQHVIIQISDNGNGIKQEDLPYIFIRYFQSKNKAKQKNGSGIGLYIVRKFIELHHGHVEINSAGENQGTSVVITLPYSIENSIPLSQSLEMSDKKVEIDKGQPLLLIIDDNQEIATYLVNELSRDYRYVCASNGKEGIVIAYEQQPDLVIADLMMPEMDGIEFCKLLRKSQPTSTIPVIMLTAKDDKVTEFKSIKAGIDVFMSKPFDIEKLRLRIKQLLDTRRAVEKKLRIETIGAPALIENYESCTDEDGFFMTKLTAIIEENMENSEFNVTMLCQLLKTNNKQLCRKTKQLTGTKPVDFIRQVRMKRAAMLLAQNRFSVSEVMYMVGYSNPSYFSKCFVAEFKVLPSQYTTETKV